MPKPPRTPARFFVSYARAEKELADRFLGQLTPFLAPSRLYDYELWQDQDMGLGVDWREAIETALEACDFGLLLVTPAFLASKFITEEELPRFVGSGAKPVIPVALETVSLERHDLRGLEAYQLFRLDERSYRDMRGTPQQKKFARLLFEGIENRLDQHFDA